MSIVARALCKMKIFSLNEEYSIKVKFEVHPQDETFKRFGWRLLRYGKPFPNNRWRYPFGRDWCKVENLTPEQVYKVFEEKVIPRILKDPEVKRLMNYKHLMDYEEENY